MTQEHNGLFNKDLIRRYDKSGPRYTSYPTAVQFHTEFGPSEYKTMAGQTNLVSRADAMPRPLSLYFHIPFCDTVCFYCGCSKVVTKDRSRARPYLDHLYQEMALQSALFDEDRRVEQLHWGGGTPTFISHDEMRELMQKTRENFRLCDDDSGEYSIEIDPREVGSDTIALLRELGFNRLSLGVQDFDPRVQKAVNRIQPEAQTLAAITAARDEKFRSISVDLIYGLPLQTAESFSQTIDRILEVSPDRLSIFNYAHLPEMFKPQRRINVEDLPSAAEKLDILNNTIQQLTEGGYVYIGMDHFAKPDDELAIAQNQGSLYRNFQGYSTHADCDLIAMGITAISKVGDSYSQNEKTTDEYYRRIDAGELPVYRGLALNADDVMRRDIINRMICHYRLDIRDVENTYDIVFADYFKDEMQALEVMQTDGLLAMEAGLITILPAGWLLIRNVCMVFDVYLKPTDSQRYSKVI